jgi:hypothetical protein
MNRSLGWTFGIISLIFAGTFWLLPSFSRLLDIGAGVGYFAAAVLLIPPTRAWFLRRVLRTEWSNDVLLMYIFLCAAVGAGCAYFTRYA